VDAEILPAGGHEAEPIDLRVEVDARARAAVERDGERTVSVAAPDALDRVDVVRVAQRVEEPFAGR
jgi:hypothetical protein